MAKPVPHAGSHGPDPQYLDVLHDFAARSLDELTLRKGTTIELLEKDDEFGDGWYSGRDVETGNIGLFPQVYTTPSKRKLNPPPPPYTIVPGTLVSNTTNTSGSEPALSTDQITSINSNHSHKSSNSSLLPIQSDIPQDPAQPEQTLTSKVIERLSNSHEHGQITTTKPSGDIAQASIPSPMTSLKDMSKTEDSSMMRSPVVQNTLSDIEEAISQIRTPRASSVGGQAIPRQHEQISGFNPLVEADDSESDYSRSGHDEQHDYLEEDTSHPYKYSMSSTEHNSIDRYDVVHEEDQSSSSTGSSGLGYTLEEVRSWTPAQVSAYLQEQEIPVYICEKFEQQEVTGSILLQLEMNHLKELDISSFGKRFEVWKEIERLMNMIGLGRLSGENQPRSGSSLGVAGDERGRRPRSSTTGGTGTMLPRLPSLHNRAPSKQAALGIGRNYGEGNPERCLDYIGIDKDLEIPPPDDSPSNARRTSRRRSSNRENKEAVPMPARTRTRESSFDKGWNLPSAISEKSITSYKLTSGSSTTETQYTNDSEISSVPPASRLSEQRLNSTAVEPKRNVLHKKSGSGNHARNTSYSDESRNKGSRHSRMSSAGESGPHSPGSTVSPASMAYHVPKSRRKISQPSSDAYLYEQPKMSPSSPSKHSASTSRNTEGKTSTANTPYLPDLTQEEKRITQADNALPLPENDGIDKTPVLNESTESTVAIGENGSAPPTSLAFDATGGRRSHELKDRSATMPTSRRLRSVASASGLRQKSKKRNTSAWTEGLKEITPAEAAANGDFSGWLKKRGSGGVVNSWKSRFFVLKGRRLSYFYSESDTKERGLIDITSHRVLNAADDRLVNLHASVAAMTSPTQPGQETSAQNGGTPIITSTTNSPVIKEKDKGWFIFKLVPPAPGAAKGVMFTPPKTHYFATDTKQAGRQWMAALMKATIDRDESRPVVSSFSANTMSLAKAQELRARPPGFGDDSGTDTKSGLGIDIDYRNDETSSTSQAGESTRLSHDIDKGNNSPLSTDLHGSRTNSIGKKTKNPLQNSLHLSTLV